MGETTGIEWTDSTWTPIRARALATGKVGWHCTHASEGCRYCYAEGINRRLGTGLDYKPVAARELEIFLDRKMLGAPFRWRSPRMVFVCSMTDLFADFVADEMIDQVFAVMALCRHHTFQVLTKRPERAAAYLDGFAAHVRIEALLRELRPSTLWNGNVHEAAVTLSCGRPLPNVWLGFSAEDAPNFAARAEAVRPLAEARWMVWCSAEPLLDGIELGPAAAWLKWLVVGGESGPKARPLWVPSVRSLVRQCGRANIPILVKQLGRNVQDRNDAGWGEDWPDSWPEMDPDDVVEDPNGNHDHGYQGAPVRIRLNSSKGGDMAEWPPDLRVRQFPALRPAAIAA